MLRHAPTWVILLGCLTACGGGDDAASGECRRFQHGDTTPDRLQVSSVSAEPGDSITVSREDDGVVGAHLFLVSQQSDDCALYYLYFENANSSDSVWRAVQDPEEYFGTGYMRAGAPLTAVTHLLPESLRSGRYLVCDGTSDCTDLQVVAAG